MNHRIKHHKQLHREKIRILIEEFLADHPCVECGESDPIVLEFNHIDPATKLFNISAAPRMRFSLAKVRSEIDKCNIMCSNCHRKLTHKTYYPERYTAD